MISNIRHTILFIAAILACGTAAPKRAMALDWPKDAALAQRLQAVKIDIANTKLLIAASKSKKPISAASYLAVDLTTGAALLKKYPDYPRPIASVTKLMNAVVVLENIDTAKTVTITDRMLIPEGKSPCVYKGLAISVKNLLQASLTQSVNDAAEALSYAIGKEKFISLMNQKAKDLKMAKTAYYDVNGLNPKNSSTAADLSKLLAYIYKTHPKILESTKDNNFWLPNEKGELLKFQNMNYFYGVPEFMGGKSGYLPEAKNNFASIFNIKGKPVAIVLLRSANLQADTYQIINQLKTLK